MTGAPLHLLPGSMELLILKALVWEPTHGWGVAEWIRLVTDNAFAVEEGTFYPALKRLEAAGAITSEWGTSENGRKAKFYTVTPAGRHRLRDGLAEWDRYTAAVDRAFRHGYPRALWAGSPSQAPGGAGARGSPGARSGP